MKLLAPSIELRPVSFTSNRLSGALRCPPAVAHVLAVDASGGTCHDHLDESTKPRVRGHRQSMRFDLCGRELVEHDRDEARVRTLDVVARGTRRETEQQLPEQAGDRDGAALPRQIRPRVRLDKQTVPLERRAPMNTMAHRGAAALGDGTRTRRGRRHVRLVSGTFTFRAICLAEVRQMGLDARAEHGHNVSLGA